MIYHMFFSRPFLLLFVFLMTYPQPSLAEDKVPPQFRTDALTNPS